MTEQFSKLSRRNGEIKNSKSWYKIEVLFLTASVPLRRRLAVCCQHATQHLTRGIHNTQQVPCQSTNISNFKTKYCWSVSISNSTFPSTFVYILSIFKIPIVSPFIHRKLYILGGYVQPLCGYKAQVNKLLCGYKDEVIQPFLVTKKWIQLPGCYKRSGNPATLWPHAIQCICGHKAWVIQSIGGYKVLVIQSICGYKAFVIQSICGYKASVIQSICGYKAQEVQSICV